MNDTRGSNASPKTTPKAVLVTGLLAGTLDIGAAFVNYYAVTGRNPVRVLRYIASAAFGRAAAYADGAIMPVLGLVFHYVIAMTFTAIFFFAYPRVPALRRRPVVTGLLYGVVVWVIMNLGVLPLSRVQRAPLEPGPVGLAVVILMFAIGLPISFSAHRHYTRARRETRSVS